MFKIQLDKFKQRYKELEKAFEKATDIYDNADASKRQSTKKEADDAENMLISFIEAEYSKFVFLNYLQENPTLIDRLTKKECSFKSAFGESFENLSKSEKKSLVGLIEGFGKYKFK